MGNTKYPSGLKGKAGLAWVGGAAIGFCPLFFFYSTALIKEHYTGNCPRKTYGEEKYFHFWMVSAHRHSVQMAEMLRVHPQYQFSHLDKRRLKLNELEKIDQ